MIELNEEELNEALSKLEKGEKVVIGDTIYLNPPEPAPICPEHDFEYAGDESNGFIAVKCRNCINGKIYDSTTHKLEGGKIRPLN